MKRQITKYFVIGVLTLLYSCSPMTKESYLNDYKEFINEIGTKKATYTAEDWQNADIKFQQFSEEWYTKFEDELIWKEELTLTGYAVEYNLYRYTEDATTVINGIFDDYDKLEKRVKYYAANNMDADIEMLIKQAEKLGGIKAKILREILDNINIEYSAEFKISSDPKSDE